MKKTALNGTWRMRACGEAESYAAQVPGSVLSALLDAGAVPDPYDRMNEYEVRDLFYKDYEFERTISVDEETLAFPYTDLVCQGLDTLATIYINDTMVCTTNNMHRTYRIPVRDYLKCGENQIRIVFASPISYVENYEVVPGREISCIPSGGTKGNQYLRKTHSMFGWDWGAQLPDAGIWREIALESYGEARIEQVRIKQIHENGEVKLRISTQLHQYESKKYKVSITLGRVYHNNVRIPKIELQAKTGLVMDGCTLNEMELQVEKPRLWWPNGMGDQDLYELTVSLKPAGVLSGGEAALDITKIEPLDQKTFLIGLREIQVCRQKDTWGEEFCFRVNGQKLFAKGANYIPEDCIYSRITKDRIEYLTDSSKRANYNMLRVWGGGYYPSDAFYDACDRKGLLVWQDMMFACNGYDLTQEMEDTLVPEIHDNVRRLRHHASLALWCGNNEIESGILYWPEFVETAESIKADYIKIFEYLIPKAIREEDEETFYWPSSPSSCGCYDDPCNPDKGDMHYWDVWHGQKPFSDYQKHIFRFVSEFGFQSFPCMKTVSSFAREEDQNIFSDVMESHQKNTSANGKMLYYVSENFRYPKDFASLLYVTQVLQAIAVRSGVEHWRRCYPRCMGTLYWQINDNWPVASWASLDYYGRWKPLHYMAVNFYAPAAGSIYRTVGSDGSFTGISAHVQNESPANVTAKVSLKLRRMNGEVICSDEMSAQLSPYSEQELLVRDYEELLHPEDAACLRPEVRAKMKDRLSKKEVYVEAVFTIETPEGVQTDYQAECFLPYKYMKLPKPEIQVAVEEKEDVYEIALSSEAFAPFVTLDFDDADVIFSDNCIMLTSKETRIITLAKKDILRGSFASAEDVRDRLRLMSLRDTY